jgi:hypothetical protein
MSWKATGFVKELTGLGSSEKLLLMILSDYYNEEEGAAWPSIPRLAKEVGVSERQVYRLIMQLESQLVLTVLHGRGRTSNRYSFVGYPCHNVTPDMDVTSDLTPVSPEPVKKPTTEEEAALLEREWDEACARIKITSGVDHLNYWKSCHKVPEITPALEHMLVRMLDFNPDLILMPGSVSRLAVAAEMLAPLDLHDPSFGVTMPGIGVLKPNCLQTLAKGPIDWAAGIRASYGKVSI